MDFGKTIDTLKPLVEICLPDPRHESIVILDSPGAAFRLRTLEDHHRDIEAIALGPSVPTDVRVQFDVARNLMLYSWHVLRFMVSAQLQAFASLEYALRKRALVEGIELTGLRKLLKSAIECGWVADADIERFRILKRRRDDLDLVVRAVLGSHGMPEVADPQTYCRILVEAIPTLRNDLAHGSETLQGGYLQLQVCSDLINQLFPPSNGPHAEPD